MFLDFMTSTDEKPSVCETSYWIYAINGRSSYPVHTERCGKWLIFRDVSQIDECWKAIKDAIHRGDLGRLAKVSTALPNENARDPNVKVICVYTYDSDDVDDVMRVRRNLADLGFIDPLPYKTDISTLKGEYSVRGHKKISKYYV